MQQSFAQTNSGVVRRWRLMNVARVLRRWQSYVNVSYLLTAFPLGLMYFVLVVVLVSVGLSTVVAGFGVVLLFATLLCARWIGGFERELTMWWLGIEIVPMEPVPQPGVQPPTFWQWSVGLVRNRITWTSLLYLLVKFPFGILAFAVIFSLIATSVGLIFAPLWAIFDLSSTGSIDATGFFNLLATPVLVALGVALLVVTLYVGDGLTWIWTQFARATLGISESEAQLASARATAAQAQALAVRAEQSRRELIVNVSHDLRTPIASIRGHVESLQMATEDAGAGASGDASEPAELRRYLAIIAQESERLSALVDDLLALARADAGELRLDVRPTAAGEVIAEVYESLVALARRERQVTVIQRVAPDLPLVVADRQRLSQVLLNLARNAITYTPAGGLVSLTAERVDAGHVALVVADTGVGIAPEEQEHIFERFYRTDASRTRGSGGFGLGLAIVRDLVRAMGGTVTVRSVVGEGSRFLVTLPVAREV